MLQIGEGKTMEYQHKYTRNPFRIAHSIWRVVKNLGSTSDALVLEEVFNNSRLTRRFAAWEQVAERLIPHDVTAEQLGRLPRLTDLDLKKMTESHLPGTIGFALANHMTKNKLNPNLFEPAKVESRRDYVLNHLPETHDTWHIVTGYGTDIPGEFALISFYAAQIGAPAFTMLLGVGLLNTAFFAHHDMEGRLSAIAEGWRAGKRAKSLFGIDWKAQFDRPVEEFRAEYSLPSQADVGTGISKL
jgi:ubiquinone biosynthesis protein COQ4